MIRFIDVTKYFVTNFGRHYVFKNVSLDLPLDRNVGIMGPNGAGKSTFLRLLSGADQPSSGTIIKSGRISPPMGLTPGLQGSLSALENVRFAGRIYGMKREEIDEMVAFVRDLAKIGKYFDMPIDTYSAGMRQRIAFGINMSMRFDYYLFDEISAGGDREFRKAAKAMVAERLKTSRFVMTSHDTHELLELCHAGIVIRNGELTYFDDIRDAATFYGEAQDNRRRRRSKRHVALAADDSISPANGGGETETEETRKSRKKRRKTKRRARRSEGKKDGVRRRRGRKTGANIEAEGQSPSHQSNPLPTDMHPPVERPPQVAEKTPHTVASQTGTRPSDESGQPSNDGAAIPPLRGKAKVLNSPEQISISAASVMEAGNLQSAEPRTRKRGRRVDRRITSRTKSASRAIQSETKAPLEVRIDKPQAPPWSGKPRGT